MKTAAGLFVLLTMSGAALGAQAPVLVGDRHCLLVNTVRGADETVEWKGPCKDGYADGAGVLQRQRRGLLLATHLARYEVTMARGQISGAGSVKYANGNTYTGTFKDGKRDGKGYAANADGAQYEGDYKDDLPHGTGNYLGNDRSEYVGEWKNGKRDGIGTMTYALGGRYEGAWKAGKFDGKGILTYAGSGHRHEGQFRDGRVLGAPAAALVREERHSIRRDYPATGSLIREEAVSGTVPFDKPYAALTAGQQAAVKAPYLALEEGDEPPYPLNGLKPIYDWINKAQGKLLIEGDLRLYVLVGKDGNPLSVTTIGSPHPEMTKFAALVVMKEKYKPAVCRGEPCDMMYPFAMRFDVSR